MGWRKRGRFVLLAILLFVGGAGCMNKEAETPQDQILVHLEDTYGETFEVEAFKEGSAIFKSMYGSDQLIAHPEGKPAYAFLAGEKRDAEGEYFDTYVLSIWSEEIRDKFSKEIEKFLPENAEYRVSLHIEDGKYDASMKETSVFDYFANQNKDAAVVLNIALKTANAPEPSDYNEEVFELLQLVSTLGVDSYGVTVGFVDAAEDISDYIRTSHVNNVPWSNVDAKVYGTIMVDNFYEITEPSQIQDYYEAFEE